MSDDGYARYRKNESYGRGGSSGPSAHGEDDPLAELARLIGQDQSAPPPDWRASPASYEDYQYPSEQQADSRYPNRGYPTHDAYGSQPSDNQSFNAYGDQHLQAGHSETGQQLGQRYEDPRHFGDRRSDDDYEEPTPSRSRGGVVTFVVVLGLAGLGTAGAFAYRSLFHGSAGNSPPVILADASPNKIVPTNQSSDSTGQADSSRPDLGQVERMVSREERPLNVQSASSALGVVYPGNSPAAQPPMAANGPPILAPAPQPAPPPAPGEPRRVRTVIIRPDQQGDPRVASSNAAFPTGSTSARNANQKPPDGDAPLSLAPQGPPPDSSTAHPKLASTTSRPVPPPPAAAPPPVSIPAAAAGSFFVQISAQKSEEDAQTTFRTMQAKYPDQLGGRQPVIRRKDLDKGVFFGVQVGPFASRDEAVQLCESLKSAGGACMIQKN
jgi:cell division septation protein DedD